MIETTEIAQLETFLTKDDIYAADDLKTEPVAVPEWGGKVLVKGLTGTERDAYFHSLSKIDPATKMPKPDNTNATAKLLVLCMVTPGGERMFTGTTDVLALGRKNGAALQRVSDVAERLSGIGAAAAKDAEGNSDATPSDGSTSSPPEQQG